MSADCIICNPGGHMRCRCSTRCEEHRDTPDPIADRLALTDAVDVFNQAVRTEVDAIHALSRATSRREAAERSLREIQGGRI